MSSDGGHLGWISGPVNIILKGDHQRTITPKFVPNRRVSDEKIFHCFSHRVYVKTMSADGGHLGWTSGPTDTILKGDHPRTIPSEFGPNWPSSFREEDF